jgi:hypothetical protein
MCSSILRPFQFISVGGKLADADEDTDAVADADANVAANFCDKIAFTQEFATFNEGTLTS